MRNEVVIECKLKTKRFEKQIKEVEYQLKEIDFELSHAKELKLSTKSIDELNLRAEKLKNKLITLRKRQQEVDRQGLKNFEKSLSTIGNKTGDVIKKIGKWALAIFGIRTAYNAVRSAISTLAQYDDKLATDVEYIRYALATTLEPVIKNIVNLVYTLLQYVNYLAKAWFNVDLFASASEKRFKSAGKAAKDMSKSLFGFDTANVLGGGSAAATSSGAPSMDLSAPEDVKIPSWLQWIKDNGREIAAILGSIATALVLVKLGLDSLTSAGIGISIFGLVKLFYDLKDAVDEVNSSLGEISFDTLGNIIIDIGIVVGGLALAFLNLPLAIGAAITLIVGILVKYWDKIKGFFENIIKWLTEKINSFIEKGWYDLAVIFDIFENLISGILHIFDGLFTGIKQIFEGILRIFKGDFKNGFISIAKGIANIVIGIINGLIKGINAIISPIRALIVAVGKVLGKNYTMENIKIPTIPKLAVGGVVNMPGRGVYRGGGIVGEQGPEGVIPLTNDQSLQMIANAIAEKMSITLDITNKLDGRVLNKQLEQVRARNNFARNGV